MTITDRWRQVQLCPRYQRTPYECKISSVVIIFRTPVKFQGLDIYRFVGDSFAGGSASYTLRARSPPQKSIYRKGTSNRQFNRPDQLNITILDTNLSLVSILYGCFVSFISVTRSAMSKIWSDAFRPVRIIWI